MQQILNIFKYCEHQTDRFSVIGVWRRRKPISALKVSEISTFIQDRLG